MYPELKKWINQCIICQATGYKPEMPEHISREFSMAAQNIKGYFNPIYVNELNICVQCEKIVASKQLGDIKMELQKIIGDFSVCKISNIDQVDFTREFVFLSKTSDEISLVCETNCVPSNIIAVEHGWKALKISGILDFGMVGVIAKISKLLAESEIAVFVISTYNTDYILLKTESFDNGVKVLMHNGYVIK